MSNTRLTRWALRGSLLAAGVAAFAFPALASGGASVSAQEASWGEAVMTNGSPFFDQFLNAGNAGATLADGDETGREEKEASWG